MKRVLQVVNRMGYGGIEAFLMNIYRNINRKEIRFDFAVHTNQKGEYDDEIKKMGGNIYYFTSRGKSIGKYYKDWNNFLKENAKNYSAIHMHVSSLTTILPLVIAKKYKIKYRIIHAHNTYQKGKLHEILSKINKTRIKKYATRLLACSSEAGNYVFGNNNYEKINNGIDLEKYQFNKEKRNEMRKRLGVEEKDTVYINIARLTEEKNQSYLIDVFKQISLKEKNSKLLIVGKGHLKEDLEEKIKKENLEKKITLFNGRNDIPNLLQAADVFILPSLYEGLPVVAIEAQAADLKCFISKNVSPEVKLNDSLEFLDITNTEKETAKLILENKMHERNNVTGEKIKEYDIVRISKYLLDQIYTKERK